MQIVALWCGRKFFALQWRLRFNSSLTSEAQRVKEGDEGGTRISERLPRGGKPADGY